MAGRTEGIETVSDLDPDTILGWAPGDGIIIEQTSGAGGGGTFGTLAVNVTAGAEEERTEQVTVARGDGNAVTITVTSLDADTFRAGLNAGPFGISGRDTDETASSVTFTIPDITTTEGRAALDMYLNAQALPGVGAGRLVEGRDALIGGDEGGRQRVRVGGGEGGRAGGQQW